jgi:hypothetical protein
VPRTYYQRRTGSGLYWLRCGRAPRCRRDAEGRYTPATPGHRAGQVAGEDLLRDARRAHGNDVRDGQREYFPKGTEITDDQAYLDLVARERNNRPRRILGYRTPAEVFTDLLASSIASTG